MICITSPTVQPQEVRMWSSGSRVIRGVAEAAVEKAARGVGRRAYMQEESMGEGVRKTSILVLL